MFFIVVIFAIAAVLAYIRLAPTDVAHWHQPITKAQSADGQGWSARVVPATPALLSELHQAMLYQPRTELIAGNVPDGRLTYITRSRLMGYPDYTTIEQDGEQIKLLGRLRFGKSDLGVNGKRLDRVLEQVNAKKVGG